jgi:hypothetical protein
MDSKKLAQNQTKPSLMTLDIAALILGVTIVPYLDDNIEMIQNFERIQIKQIPGNKQMLVCH